MKTKCKSSNKIIKSRKQSKRKIVKSHKGGGIFELLTIIKFNEQKDYYVTFDGVKLKMEIYNNIINFKHNNDTCIGLTLEEKILRLKNFFYDFKTSKIVCTDKGQNINIIEDLNNRLIQSSENTTIFFMNLIDQFAIHLGCNEIKLIDDSHFKNKTCDFSGYYPMLFASGRSFYGKYGFHKNNIKDYNVFLSTILLPVRQMNVFTLKQIKYIDQNNTIESPFFADNIDNIDNKSQNMNKSQTRRREYILKRRKEYIFKTTAQMEELCNKLNLKNPVVSIDELYKTIRDYCKNDNNTPLDLSFSLDDHYDNLLEIFDFYYFPGDHYHKKIFEKNAGDISMSTLNAKTNLFEMSPVIKKELIITSID